MSVGFWGVRAPVLRRLVIGLALFTATAVQATPLAPEPRKPIDPERYLGRWYEIARVPNALQDRCEGATSDWSKARDGQYDVVQTCHIGSPSGPAKVWKGAAHMIAPSKIRIGFFGGFVHQDYWVIDRGDDYSWSIMGTPDPRYVWIMSRRAVLSPQQKAALVARTRALGYDTAALVYDQQSPSA
jgi:apolipoprotein D and lipocalin family protein